MTHVKLSLVATLNIQNVNTGNITENGILENISHLSQIGSSFFLRLWHVMYLNMFREVASSSTVNLIIISM